MSAPKIRRLKFDRNVWHPLDHRIGSGRCIAFQFTKWESIRTHARYWWMFKRDTDMCGLYRVVFCWWGHHKMQTWHSHATGRINTVCVWCSKSSGWVDK